MQPICKRSDLKEHIARVAATLFYNEGVNAVGVDRVADVAKTTKRTVYHHYSSKAALIAAALRLAPIVHFPEEGSPVDRIIGSFTAMQNFLSDTDYRGCPYNIFTAELTERYHPARQLVERRIARRRAWFRARVTEAGATDPEFLAEQLDVLFDGALSAGTKRGDARPVQAALAAVQTLIRASCAAGGVA